MTEKPSCLLTLVFPPSLEEDLIGLLLEHPQWGSRFVCLRADGHGQEMPLSGGGELVRGRAPRRIVELVILREEVQPLLAALRQAVASPEVAYWLVELAESGRLA